MKFEETVKISWNLEVLVHTRAGWLRHHQRTHNIVTNTGRQFLAESITASLFGPGTFVRHRDEVIRYIGFGIGGNRQTNPAAGSSPLADAYPAGYGGTNTQTDVDVTVAGLERPVLVSLGPDLWMKEVVAPGTFPTPLQTTFIATFGQTEINVGPHAAMPLSEIALYTSGADPALPNGSAGPYPGAGGYAVAYDNFNDLQKTGLFDIQVRWTWRFGV